MFTPKRKKKMLKEMKDLNKGKRMICLWIGRVNIAKAAILSPKLSTNSK